MDLEWLTSPVVVLDGLNKEAAQQHQAQLTKPPGSLGLLEELAVRLAEMQATISPRVDNICIAVFAADHGVAAEGVSAFPQEVTTQMLANFASGGAAISVLARELGARLEVIDVGVVKDPGSISGVTAARVAAGTANFLNQAAMTEDQLSTALTVGKHAAERAARSGQLFIAGDMGIANTTAATAMACALLNLTPATLAGPGTGLSEQGVAHKVRVIEQALATHANQLDEPLSCLRVLGGLEIAAIGGAFLRCAQLGIPVLVDGFIATASALVAQRINPAVLDWMLFAHCSAEPGHQHLLDALNVVPLLSLQMRLGEGSGAAVAVPLIRLALALHSNMATFDQAGVASA